MVSSITETDRQCAAARTWVLRPNRSLSWREAKLFYGGILAVSLGIALSFAVLGFWPVLPFAGLELLALGAAFYWCQWQGERVEVISVRGDRVAVEKGHRRVEARWDFERAWVQVQVLRPRFAGYPSQLVLRSHGREVAIGDFLVEEERRRVAGELRRILAANEAPHGLPGDALARNDAG